MAENRPEAIAELCERALWALEHADQAEPTQVLLGYRSVLRLWHYPSFDQHMSLTQFEHVHDSGRPMRVRAIIWDRPHDMARFADPLEGVRQGFHAPPTIIVRDAEIAREELDPIMRALNVARIPVTGVDVYFGLDGESYGIAVAGARLEWWEDGPRKWRTLTRTVARLREVLQRCSQGNDATD